jgi:hypothetical protein
MSEEELMVGQPFAWRIPKRVKSAQKGKCSVNHYEKNRTEQRNKIQKLKNCCVPSIPPQKIRTPAGTPCAE